ncbi:hypothetical protein IBX65_08905 [Candidatus Aerophobetes bacterium]|nr:hypothetical protein [Candidatus Aerophobetes bacterium]
MKKIVIGTRASKLALRQAEEVKAVLEELNSDVEVIFKKIKTRGDALKDWRPEGSQGEKGLFVKEKKDEYIV